MMLQRFMELKEFIDPMNTELADIMPSAKEMIELKKLGEHMSNFQSITMQLQKEVINLHEVRVLFDATVKEYPVMARYLAPDSSIIHSPHFENGLVKLLLHGDNCSLLREEKHALQKLKMDEVTSNSPQKELSFAERAMKVLKESPKNYKSVSFISPTSNAVERLFSTAKFVFSDLRRSLLPRNLEMLLFLKSNRDLWDLELVAKVVNQKKYKK